MRLAPCAAPVASRRSTISARTPSTSPRPGRPGTPTSTCWPSCPPVSTPGRRCGGLGQAQRPGAALPGDGPAIALEHAGDLPGATLVGTTVTVDMEDHTTTDATLEAVRELRRDFPTTGVVLQAYLHRTEADCRDVAGPGSRVRLCKGAYAEPASVAFQSASGWTGPMSAASRCSWPARATR